MPSDAKELFKRVKQDTEDRDVWESKQATCYRLRFGTQKRRKKPYKDASDFPWLLIDTDIEKAKPAFVEQVLGPELIASFFAKKSQAKAFTTAVARWFNYKLKEESNLVIEYLKVIDAFMQGGKGFMKIFWNAQEKCLEYQSISPIFLIAPPWTGPLQRSDRSAHVMWMSKFEYERRAQSMGYNDDKDFIKRISGNGESTDGKGSDLYAEAKKMREGIGWHQKKDMVILWEIFERQLDNTIQVHTLSPLVHDEFVRPSFKLPYKHGKIPIVEYNYEITEGGFYSPRGMAEILGVYQQLLKVLLDTSWDYLNYCNRPIFKPATGAAPINVQNLDFVLGQLINADIVPVQFPAPTIDFISMQQNVRGIAEQRIGAPDLGLSTQVQSSPSKQPKTAQESKQIGQVTAARQNLGSRIFMLSHKELLDQSLSLLLQYNSDDLQYFWRDDYVSLPPDAFKEDEDVYELRATGSADGYSREMELQQLLQLRAAFIGTPTWNDAECQKRALELINPELVKFLYIDVPTGLQDQAKNQADEVATMSFGFEPMPSQEDNDLIHIQTIEQFKSHVINTGHQLPPDFLMVLLRHEDAHIKALQRKEPAQYKMNQQMILTIQSQNATIAKQVLQMTQQALAQQGTHPGTPPPQHQGPPGAAPGASAAPGGPSQPLQLAIPNPYQGITGAKPPVPPGAGGMVNQPGQPVPKVNQPPTRP